MRGTPPEAFGGVEEERRGRVLPSHAQQVVKQAFCGILWCGGQTTEEGKAGAG